MSHQICLFYLFFSALALGLAQANLLSTCAKPDVDCEAEALSMAKSNFQQLYEEFIEDPDIKALFEDEDQKRMIEFWLDFLNATETDTVHKYLKSSEELDLLDQTEGELEKALEEQLALFDELHLHVSDHEDLSEDHLVLLKAVNETDELLKFFEVGNNVLAIFKSLEIVHQLEANVGDEPLDVVALEKSVTGDEETESSEEEEEEEVDQGEELLKPLSEDEQRIVERAAVAVAEAEAEAEFDGHQAFAEAEFDDRVERSAAAESSAEAEAEAESAGFLKRAKLEQKAIKTSTTIASTMLMISLLIVAVVLAVGIIFKRKLSNRFLHLRVRYFSVRPTSS